MAAQLERASLEEAVATIGDGVAVEPSQLEGAGRGLYARGRAFRRGQRITEYAGERLADKLEAARRPVQTHILHLSATYHGQHGNDVYVDGDRNPVRGHGGGSFANHRPKGQCNADFALRDGSAFLVATRDIADGEEIYVHCGTDLNVMMGRARREVYDGCDGRASFRLVPATVPPSSSPPPENLALGAAVQAARERPRGKSPLARAPSPGRPGGVHTIADLAEGEWRCAECDGRATIANPLLRCFYADKPERCRKAWHQHRCAGHKLAKAKVVEGRGQAYVCCYAHYAQFEQAHPAAKYVCPDDESPALPLVPPPPR